VTLHEPAAVVYNRFRAFDPWPGVSMRSGEELLKLTDMRRADGSGEPRTVLSIGEDVVIACGEGAIRVLELQRPGKPRTAAGAVARGLGWRAGAVLP
jgi:methionyl-tRNA formyltransferase